MPVTKQQIAVPAYFGVNQDWKAIEGAGKNVSLVVADSSFPTLTGDGLKAAQDQFDACRLAGQLVLGYVDTQFGKFSQKQILAAAGSWYASYGGHIDGVFFDDGPYLVENTDQFFQTFYTGLVKAFKAAQPKDNKVFLNASQYPNDWVVKLADYVIVFENSMATYFDPTTYSAIGEGGALVGVPAFWTDPQYAQKMAHIIFDCPDDGGSVTQVVNCSKSRGAGNVYVIDSSTATYPALPPYWADELKAAEGAGGTGCPQG